MDVYAQTIYQALIDDGIDARFFRPSSRLEQFASNKLVARYLRYVRYPDLIAKRGLDSIIQVQHVVDHGYAHLLPRLKADYRLCSAHDLIPVLTWLRKIEYEVNADVSSTKSNLPRRKPLLNLHSLSYLASYERIITISENSAHDLIEFLDIDAKKISVIPPILSPRFQRADHAECLALRERYALSSDTKWVMLSGREYYKNHQTALRAIAQLRRQNSDVSIGVIKTGWESSEFNDWVSQIGLADCTVSIKVDASELPAVYSTVDCLLFPSLYEGFGMPIAEALACGTPVVASNRGSIPEVAGNLLEYHDPFDVSAITNALQHALFDLGYREQIRTNGPGQMAKYRPEVVRKALIAAYQLN